MIVAALLFVLGLVIFVIELRRAPAVSGDVPRSRHGAVSGALVSLLLVAISPSCLLLDDRDQGAGGKFATADLIGIPYQLIVGPRGLKDGQVEIKHRKSGERETLSLEAAVGRLEALIVPQRRDTV